MSNLRVLYLIESQMESLRRQRSEVIAALDVVDNRRMKREREKLTKAHGHQPQSKRG